MHPVLMMQSEGDEGSEEDGYEQTSISWPPSLAGEMQHVTLLSFVVQSTGVVSLQTLPLPCCPVNGSQAKLTLQVEVQVTGTALRQRSGAVLSHVKHFGLSDDIVPPSKIVTQTALFAFPSGGLSVSKRAQASPVLLPVQFVSSKFQLIKELLPPVPQVPTLQNWFRSFWPGKSSTPCRSFVQPAGVGQTDVTATGPGWLPAASRAVGFSARPARIAVCA